MNILKEYKNRVVSGKELKEILGDYSVCLLKFMNDNDKHHGLIYRTGLNVDVETFNPSGECSKGGIYFCHVFDGFHHVGGYGKFARQVFLMDDMRIYIEDGKMKADKVILGEKMNKQDMITSMIKSALKINQIQTYYALMEVVKKNGHMIKYIDEEFRTLDMMMEAVKNAGNVISHIHQKYRTCEMMMEAVKNDGHAICHIDRKDRSNEMMMEAIKNDGHVICHINRKDRSKEMMMEAVKNNGLAIRHIKNNDRTKKMMMEAIKNNGLAIFHIRKKFRTRDMMMEATKNNSLVIEYIDKKDRLNDGNRIGQLINASLESDVDLDSD